MGSKPKPCLKTISATVKISAWWRMMRNRFVFVVFDFCRNQRSNVVAIAKRMKKRGPTRVQGEMSVSPVRRMNKTAKRRISTVRIRSAGNAFFNLILDTGYWKLVGGNKEIWK